MNLLKLSRLLGVQRLSQDQFPQFRYIKIKDGGKDDSSNISNKTLCDN